MTLPRLSFLTKPRLAIIAIIISWIIWGSASVAIKVGLEEFPLYSLIFYRFLIASLLVLPFLIPRLTQLHLTWNDFKKIFVAGSLGTTLSILFAFLGLQRTGAIEATLVFSIIPILGLIGGYFFLREKITAHEVVGILLGLVGTFVVFLKPIIETGELFSESLLGNFYNFLAALSWVVFTIYSKELFTRFSPFTLSSLSFIVGVITFFPLMIWDNFLYPDWTKTISPNALASLLFLAVFSSLAAFLLYEWGVKNSQVGKIGVLSNIQLLSATILAILILGESLTIYLILGASLITLGVVYANLKDSPSTLRTHHPHHKHKI